MSTPTYRALLIGNSTYPNDPGNLPDLEGPRNDLSLLRDALSDERYGLFPSDNVRLVAERTMPEVLREIEELLRSTTSRDCVLVYYSGHGRLDQSNDFYLCTRDTHADFLRSTAVNAGTVSKMIDESAAGTTIILLDCCHSGAFKTGEDVAQRLAGGGRFVITSCRTGELANDADAQNHASMFTHWLVEGLRGGAPDEDGDGLIGLEGLYDFLFSRLRELGRPTPQKRFSGSGDVPIALRSPSEPQGTGPGGLIEQISAVPILDVSPLEIDLGELAPGEPVPAERIAVINRGGGTLEWTADSSDEWVGVSTDAAGVLVRVDPRPGLNRANVFVRDEGTGLIRTVRVRARVSEVGIVAGPSGSDRTGIGGPIPSAGVTAFRWGRVAELLGPVAAMVAGLIALVTSAHYVDYIRAQRGDFVMLRTDNWGTGLFDSAVLGAMLALAGLLALAPLWRRPMLAACFGLAVMLVALRVGEVIRMQRITEGPGVWFTTVTLLAAVVTAVACALSWRQHGSRPWAPVVPLAVAVAAGLVWSVAHLIKPYHDYRGGIGDPSQTGLVWLLTAVVIVALILFATRLEWILGISLLCVVALVPVVDVIGDIIWRVSGRQGAERGAVGWWITYLAVIVLVVSVGTLLRPPPLGTARASLAPLRRLRRGR